MSLFLDTFKIVIYDALGKIGLLQEVYRHDEHVISYDRYIGNHLPYCNCSDIPSDSETILNSMYNPWGGKGAWATGSLSDDINDAAGVA